MTLINEINSQYRSVVMQFIILFCEKNKLEFQGWVNNSQVVVLSSTVYRIETIINDIQHEDETL